METLSRQELIFNFLKEEFSEIRFHLGLHKPIIIMWTSRSTSVHIECFRTNRGSRFVLQKNNHFETTSCHRDIFNGMWQVVYDLMLGLCVTMDNARIYVQENPDNLIEVLPIGPLAQR